MIKQRLIKQAWKQARNGGDTTQGFAGPATGSVVKAAEIAFRMTPEEKKMVSEVVPQVVQLLGKNAPLVQTLVQQEASGAIASTTVPKPQPVYEFPKTPFPEAELRNAALLNKKEEPKEGWFAWAKRNISNGFFYIMGNPVLLVIVMAFLVYLKRFLCESLNANQISLLDAKDNNGVIYDFILRWTPNILQSVVSSLSSVIQNPFLIAAGSALMSYYAESVMLALLGGGKTVEQNNENKLRGQVMSYTPAFLMFVHFVISGCQGVVVQETSLQYATRAGPLVEGTELELKNKVDAFLTEYPLGIISSEDLYNMGKQTVYNILLGEKEKLQLVPMHTPQQRRYYRVLRFFFNEI